jgi:hypothetical protein
VKRTRCARLGGEAQVPGERGRLENGAPTIESHFLGQCLRSHKAADFRQQLLAREDVAIERRSDGSCQTVKFL